MLNKLKSFFSKQPPLYTIDRPEESEVFLNARNIMGRFIQQKMYENGGFDEGFAWLRKELTSPSFDDMNFSYKNQVFSLLVELKDNGVNILPEHRKKIFNEVCAKNNLIPCIFPIDASTLKPLGNNWNLFHLLTNSEVNPLALASDEKIPMSEWEFNNFAIFQVMQIIGKQGLKIHSFCDAPDITPQIWFQDKNGKPAWVVVKYALSPKKLEDVTISNIEQIASTVQNYDGYIARLEFAPMHQTGFCRKNGFFVKSNGLEKVYKANINN